MLIILFLALALRIPLLSQSLWLDESLQALALMGKMGPILEYSLSDFQPPLYHLLTYPIQKIVGYSEIALRFPSLIFAVLSIIAAIELTRLISGTKASYIVGILLATNPLHIYYSQEARSYMLTTFLFTFSTLYLIKLLKGEKKKRDIYLYVIFTSLTLWSSYTAWFGIISHSVVIFMTRRKRDVLKYNILAYLTFIPWIKSLFSQLNIGFSTLRSAPLWGQVVGGSGFRELALTWLKFQIGRVSLENNALYLALALILFLVHVIILTKRPPNKPVTFILILAPILALIFSTFLPIYSYFRLLYLLPLYTVVFGSSLSSFRTHFIALLVSLNIALLSYYWLTPRFHKEDWRSAMSSVVDYAEGSWIIALPSIAQNAPIKYYFPLARTIELRSIDNRKYDQIFYFKYAENIFDPTLSGKSIIETQGYSVTSEHTFAGSVHLIVYTIGNENSN